MNELRKITIDEVMEKVKFLPNEFVIEDWPYGRTNKCQMKFTIETHKNGKQQRMVKQSCYNGKWNKPKKTTYAFKSMLISFEGKIGRLDISPYGSIAIRLEDSSFGESNFYDEEFNKILTWLKTVDQI